MLSPTTMREKYRCHRHCYILSRSNHHAIITLLVLLFFCTSLASASAHVKGSPSFPPPPPSSSSYSDRTTLTRTRRQRGRPRNRRSCSRVDEASNGNVNSITSASRNHNYSSRTLPYLEESLTTAAAVSRSSEKKQQRFHLQSMQSDIQHKMESLQDFIHERLLRRIPAEAWSVIAGAASFGTTLGLSTTLQQRMLGMSTGTPAPIPTLVGMASVCLASTTAHQVALATHTYATTGEWPDHFSLWPSPHQSAYGVYHHDHVVDCKVIRIPMHTIRIWTMGLVCFKLLGGRFWAVAPSSVTHLGSYARASLPATERYASARQRLQIERLGRLWGCHTCGSHRWTTPSFWNLRRSSLLPNVHFVGDHMPPKSVAEQLEKSLWYRLFRRKIRYRFYPQCISCSNKQGSLLSQATAALQKRRSATSAARRLAAVGGGRGASYNHGWHPRFSHLAGAVLGAVATVHVHPADLLDENRWRYAQWQQDFVALFARAQDALPAMPPPPSPALLRGNSTRK